MIITAYRSNKFEKTTQYKVKEILAQLPPEEMDDEMRKEMNGNGYPMFNFETESGSWICLPPHFIISIEED